MAAAVNATTHCRSSSNIAQSAGMSWPSAADVDSSRWRMIHPLRYFAELQSDGMSGRISRIQGVGGSKYPCVVDIPQSGRHRASHRFASRGTEDHRQGVRVVTSLCFVLAGTGEQRTSTDIAA